MLNCLVCHLFYHHVESTQCGFVIRFGGKDIKASYVIR